MRRAQEERDREMERFLSDIKNTINEPVADAAAAADKSARAAGAGPAKKSDRNRRGSSVSTAQWVAFESGGLFPRRTFRRQAFFFLDKISKSQSEKHSRP